MSSSFSSPFCEVVYFSAHDVLSPKPRTAEMLYPPQSQLEAPPPGATLQKTWRWGLLFGYPCFHLDQRTALSGDRTGSKIKKSKNVPFDVLGGRCSKDARYQFSHTCFRSECAAPLCRRGGVVIRILAENPRGGGFYLGGGCYWERGFSLGVYDHSVIVFSVLCFQPWFWLAHFF